MRVKWQTNFVIIQSLAGPDSNLPLPQPQELSGHRAWAHLPGANLGTATLSCSLYPHSPSHPCMAAPGSTLGRLSWPGVSRWGYGLFGEHSQVPVRYDPTQPRWHSKGGRGFCSWPIQSLCKHQSDHTWTLGCACQIVILPASLAPITNPLPDCLATHIQYPLCTHLYYLLTLHQWSLRPSQDYATANVSLAIRTGSQMSFSTMTSILSQFLTWPRSVPP